MEVSALHRVQRTAPSPPRRFVWRQTYITYNLLTTPKPIIKAYQRPHPLVAAFEGIGVGHAVIPDFVHRRFGLPCCERGVHLWAERVYIYTNPPYVITQSNIIEYKIEREKEARKQE